MSNDYWEIDGIGGVTVSASSPSMIGDRARLILHMAGASRQFKDGKAVAAHLRNIAAQCRSIADEIDACEVSDGQR